MRAGDVLAQYRIEERAGAGGMGEVYRAHDEKLNRTVALKLLPQDSVSDPDRRRRFLQEAQTASALDHPNIVTIHDIGDADGQHFIVMQYVKGRTLRELIEEGLELSTSLDYAVQMADGLAAAHAAGIVHRDLKPENVIVDDVGRPKILDFGLAKLTEPEDVYEAKTREQVHLTKEGHIVGTAAYMSPEQAQGKRVDARSDIFSFGTVLYEMVTGRQAFEGDNVAAVMAAIIKEEPQPIEPARLDALLRRTLEKDPAHRFSSVGEVKKELEEIRSSPKARAAWRTPGWRWVVAGSILVGILAYVLRPRPDPLPPPRVVPVTSYPGDELYPMLSPDGGRVAFLMNDDVYVQNISGGDALQLTDTSAAEISVTWTPDGQRITFLRATDTERAVFSISALGGAEAKITSALRGEAQGISWSPDGKTLAYADKDGFDEPWAIFLLDTNTGDRTRLTIPSANDIGDGNPIYSPDGDTVAFVRMTSRSWFSDIYLKDLKGREEVPLTSARMPIDGLDWAADGRSIIYGSYRDETGSTLYSIPVSGGEPRPIEGVEGLAYGPSVSRQGSLLVYRKRTEDWNIWRAPGPQSAGGEPEYFFGSTRQEHLPEYSPDGTRIAFSSDRSGNSEVWLCDSDGEHPVRLTQFDKHAELSRWFPDGDAILLHARLDDQLQLDVYRVSAAGGVPEQLTKELSNDAAPRLSRNGAWIYFNSDRSGSHQIWKMTVAGEKTTQLTRNGGLGAAESFDGAFVYFSKTEGGVWRVPSSGEPSEEEELVLADVTPDAWTLNEDGIAFVNEATGNFEFFDFASGEATPFASAKGQRLVGSGVSLSPDGHWFLYPQNDGPGDDIMMLENFR